MSDERVVREQVVYCLSLKELKRLGLDNMLSDVFTSDVCVLGGYRFCILFSGCHRLSVTGHRTRTRLYWNASSGTWNSGDFSNLIGSDLIAVAII